MPPDQKGVDAFSVRQQGSRKHLTSCPCIPDCNQIFHVALSPGSPSLLYSIEASASKGESCPSYCSLLILSLWLCLYLCSYDTFYRSLISAICPCAHLSPSPLTESGTPCTCVSFSLSLIIIAIIIFIIIIIVFHSQSHNSISIQHDISHL